MERAAPVLGSHTQGADAKLWAPYYLIVVFRWQFLQSLRKCQTESPFVLR